MKGIIYVCKTCGRALRSQTPPKYCYFDRIDHLENISDEDSLKMGLFSSGKGIFIEDAQIEFPGDFTYSPFTGEKQDEMSFFLRGAGTLSEFQDGLYAKVIG